MPTIFLTFHIYFFKCWHRLNEPTILHYIYIYLMKEGKILSTLGYFFFSIMNFTIGIRLVFVTGLRFGVIGDCLSVLFFLSLFCLSFVLPLLITPLVQTFLIQQYQMLNNKRTIITLRSMLLIFLVLCNVLLCVCRSEYRAVMSITISV